MTSQKKWTGSAPSNIALIKYMGKTNAQVNRPSNASLSWTLEGLRTFIEIEESSADRWEALVGPEYQKIEISEKGQARFLKHLNVIKTKFDVRGSFVVRSANNFPSDCGLASSASSFAALTKVACEAFAEMTNRKMGLADVSVLSRQGSGSSCRSLFSPWAVWEGEGAHAIELPQKNLIHQAVIVESGKKSVSSSEAHLRVTSSSLFAGRPERANVRLKNLVEALRVDEWHVAFEICWAEFWDMHVLFETASPPFSYMTPESLVVLRKAQDIWKSGQGPLVTMDAGANVHLLWKPEQKSEAMAFAKALSQFRVITTEAGVQS